MMSKPRHALTAATVLMLAQAAPAAADPLRLWPFPPDPVGPAVPLASLRCQDAIRLVEADRSVALTDAQGVTRRYVPDASLCRMASPRNAWVRTRDIAACAVGYTCEGFLGGN